MWFQIGFNLVSVVFGFPAFWFVVSNWFQLGFCGFPPSGLGLELVSKWFLWFFVWFQSGFNLVFVVSNWFQTGFKLVSHWLHSGVCGFSVVSKWFHSGVCGFWQDIGFKLVSKWFLWFPPFRFWSQTGFILVFVVSTLPVLVSNWSQSGFCGFCVVSKWFQLGFCGSGRVSPPRPNFHALGKKLTPMGHSKNLCTCVKLGNMLPLPNIFPLPDMRNTRNHVTSAALDFLIHR